MQKRRYYEFNPDSCAFEEVNDHPRPRWVVVLAWALGVVLVCGALFVIDYKLESPQELVLQAENDALRRQLARSHDRYGVFSERLDEISQTDQQLYGLLLQAEEVSEDVRQVGVGGSDVYEEFDRYSAPSASLLRLNSEQLDRLERRITLQQDRYSELRSLAIARRSALDQLPAILPADGLIVSRFGRRIDPILKVPKQHNGLDVALPVGSPVYATGDGVVETVRRERAGYGLYVVIAHPDAGYRTLYAHLSDTPDQIRRGRRVKRGDTIGFSGNSGRSVGPHVHYEVHNWDGRKLNPLTFIAPGLTPEQYQAMLASADTQSLD